MGLVGWIVVGLLAGWLSALVVPGGGREGCLANLLIGVLGGVVGGWIARELGLGDTEGFVGAVVVAAGGAILVRLVVNAFSAQPRR